MMVQRIFHTSSVRSGLCVIAIAVLAAIVYWPGLEGFWGRDDFTVLAFVRLLDTPWPLFVHDHFAAPGSIFRPLSYASWWLCERLFGSNYPAHTAASLVLHVGVCVALFALLRRVRIPHAVAMLCTLLFALHPAAIGTVLWWSARSDLLVTLFILLSLHAAIVYREDTDPGMLIAALAAALAAMLSKETGLIAIVVLSLLWLRWAWFEPANRSRALRAVALAWACGLIFLGWRWLVLGTPTSGMTAAVPIGSAIARGLHAWVQQAPGYLTFWLRMQWLERVALGSASALVVAAAITVIARRRTQLAWARLADVTVCGVCLLLLPALLQAPVAAFALGLNADLSAVEIVMQSRLYYLGIAGAMIALAAALSVLWNASATGMRMVCILPLALAAAAFAPIARDTARAYAARSLEISEVARAAVAAVAKLDLPSSQCHVMFFDIDPPVEWNTYVSMDSIVKALSSDLGRVKHCWFHENYGTPVYLQAEPAYATDAAPYVPLEVNGGPLPWRTLGGVVFAYLAPPEIAAAGPLSHMRFLRYRDGRFDDVSSAVAAGEIAVRLK